MQAALFWIFAVEIVAASALVVALPRLLHAALALVAALGGTAGLYLLLNAEFVALAQVLAYIGGVVIFIVFAILLVTKLDEKIQPVGRGKALASAVVALFFIAITLRKLAPAIGGPVAVPTADAEAGGLQAIGHRLLSPEAGGFLVAFEVVSLLLLAAIIGAITMARRPGVGGEPR